ncbi:T9SS type B sorting domain-containing protein [Salegentibacter salegens]|nr:T9SS type B sorting domain-containing protein [Salegentibacter salegens]
MKIIYLFLINFLVLSLQLNAQQEAANWYFGDGAGLSFSSGELENLDNGRLRTVEGSTSISDQNGNLLFYTDGTIVFDRNHDLMQNGTDLKGNVSTTQSAIIVPRPAHPGRYFIFTVDKPDYYLTPNDEIEGVHFSEVDMNLNNGNGGIVEGRKNIHLETYNSSNASENEFKSSEKISAVISGDCVSYWVVTQFTNKFYSFRVSESGVETTPVVSTLSNNFPPILNENDINITAGGYLKISPDGKKMAAAYTGTSLGNSNSGTKNTGKVFLYDFNDLTGKVTNEELILENSYPYGVGFSPTSSKLYITANIFNSNDFLENSELYQFDLASNNIMDSRELIHSSRNVAGGLQLAINGKVYRAGYPTDDGGYLNHTRISVINKPEEDAQNVDYRHNSVDIAPNNSKLGLPPFVQSLFKNSFEVENLCFGTSTEFTISGEPDFDAVLWEFGDGETSNTPNPSHVYSEPGTYTVALIKTRNGIPQDPVCKEITILKLPEINQDFTLQQCDITDNDPGDGITTFNLQLARNELLSAENSSVQLYFYEDEQSAIDDVENEEALRSTYRNNIPNQELTIKLVDLNGECSKLNKITLEATGGVQLNPAPVSGCELTDGEGEFNLTEIEQNIIQELGLSQNITLSFHQTENDAILGENYLPQIYLSAPKTIYIRAEADNSCYGFGSIELSLNSLPEIRDAMVTQACIDDFPLTLGNDINMPNPGDYNYSWNTGETSQTILVNAPGTYNLSITDTNLGCSREIQYIIEQFPNPEILELEIENQGETNQVTVLTNELSGLSFAMDNPDGPYQSNPTFRNVPGGTHTFYARTNNACKVAQFEEIIFGFPAFFTPNADGYNDYWLPYETNTTEFQVEYIHIFDRYGKLLKELPANSQGWDGDYNGRAMPPSDYWFKGKLANGQEFSGHFTLKR